MWWEELIKSKRFQAFIVGVVMLVVKEFLPEGTVEPETINWAVSLVIAWIIGDSVRGLPSREKEISEARSGASQ